MISENNTTEQSVMALPGKKHTFVAKSETIQPPNILLDIDSREIYKYLGNNLIIRL